MPEISIVGAYCLLCGVEDAEEIAVADNWLDPNTNAWDTEEHRLEVEKVMNSCPAIKEGEDPYKVDSPRREG